MLQSKFCARKWKLTYLICVLISHLLSVQTKNCVQNDQCSCTFDDGSGTVDLSKIGKQSGDPLIKDSYASDNYAYSFNPCYGFTEGTCVNAAACQVDPVNFIYYNIGDASKVAFSYDGSNVIGTYTADDGQRSSVVTYMCSQGVDPPQYVVNGETSLATYSFTITSSAACPNGGGPPDPSPTDGPGGKVTVSVSISTGWVLTIIFVCFVSVYLVAGVVFNKAYRHQSGRELIPNVSFWAALPGLIKEGFRFTFAKVARRDYQPI